MLSGIPVLAVLPFPQPCITRPCFPIFKYHTFDLVPPSWKTETPSVPSNLNSSESLVWD